MSRVTARRSMWAAGAYSLSLLVLYHETLWSMIATWARSDTFAHGFLIMPISLWLIWSRRDEIAATDPAPALWLALLLIPFGLIWLVASLVEVSVVQQLMLVAMIISGVWAILGGQIAGVLTFPLFFLFFAVPMGEELIYPLMKFTTSSTVWMIEMTGIPVYREGFNFALPSGRWSVIAACSGVRYIIASVTVGTLYAYLMYRSFHRRAIFVLVSAVVPVFANSVRAFLIVMVGHMSDMTIATGADHLVYGWVFFGLIIFFLFWLGAFFREDQLDAGPVNRPQAVKQFESQASSVKLLLTLLVSIGLVSAPLLLSERMFSSSVITQNASAIMPIARGEWVKIAIPGWQWRPLATASGQQSVAYKRQGRQVALIVQYVDELNPRADVVGSSAVFTLAINAWQIVGQEKWKVGLERRDVLVDEVKVRDGTAELLAWSWYLVGNLSTSNNYQAKLQEALAKLAFGKVGTYRVIVITPVETSLTSTRAHLQEFVDDYIPLLYEELRQPQMVSP